MEARAGIEPAYTDLQSAASPLRHRASPAISRALGCYLRNRRSAIRKVLRRSSTGISNALSCRMWLPDGRHWAPGEPIRGKAAQKTASSGLGLRVLVI